MNYEPLVHALTNLAWSVPTLVVCGAGVVASLVYRRQFPRPCRFLLLGCGLILAAFALSTLANAYSYQAVFAPTKETALAGWLMPILSMMSSAGRGLGVGLLVVAALCVRTEGHGVTGQNAPPGLMLPVFRAWIATASLTLYLVSLFLPAVDVGFEGLGRYRGYECLIALPTALAYPAWWANPLFAAGIVLVLRGNLILAGLCGWMAMLFSLSFSLHAWEEQSKTYESLGIGYWFWLAAMTVLAASVIPPLTKVNRGVT
jgi:hypothetical protein